MARETKVGLLAGLAFIICFAILLANRGRQDPPVGMRSSMTDGGASVPRAMQQRASRAESNPAESERRTPDGRLSPASHSASEAAAGRMDRPIANPPAASGADLPPTDTSIAGISPAPGRPAEKGSNIGIQPAERALTSHAQDDFTLRQELEKRLGIPGTNPSSTGGSNPVSPLSPQPATTTQSATYTVAPGDTLSKIALDYFGNKSRLSVNAIFEANRSVLTSPDDLKAGLVLSLPVVDGRVRTVKSGPSPSNVPAPSRSEEAKKHPNNKSGEPPPATYRWYQVKKNDGYASIAREQLGDASRWRELHEMNKDKFPNPQSIREGVRIKLPTGRILASAEGRR